MSLDLVLDGDTFEIDLEETDEGRYQVTVDGEPFDVQVDDANGGTRAEAAGTTYEVERRGRSLFVDGERVEVAVRKLAQARIGAGSGAGGEIKPPMPGRVVEILVEEGDEVEAGQPLVVLEAMKMQNEIDATGPSRVTEVRVNEDDTVEESDVLVVLEPL